MNETYMQQVVGIAHRAGAAIMEVYRSGDFGETSKADDSQLSQAALISSYRAVRERATSMVEHGDFIEFNDDSPIALKVPLQDEPKASLEERAKMPALDREEYSLASH